MILTLACHSQGLRKFGPDFQLIAIWMGERRNDRRHIRNKYKKEEKLAPDLIRFSLNNRLPIEVDDWSVIKGRAANPKKAAASQVAHSLTLSLSHPSTHSPTDARSRPHRGTERE